MTSELSWRQIIARTFRVNHQSLRGHNPTITIPQTNITANASSYFPRTIRDWNQLPVDPSGYSTLDVFKSALRDLTQGGKHSTCRTCSLSRLGRLYKRLPLTNFLINHLFTLYVQENRLPINYLIVSLILGTVRSENRLIISDHDVMRVWWWRAHATWTVFFFCEDVRVTRTGTSGSCPTPFRTCAS